MALLRLLPRCLLRVAMQLHHGTFEFALDDERHHGERTFDRRVDHILLLPARRLEYEVRHIRFRASSSALGNKIAWMTDTDPQPPVLLGRQMRGDVLQPIMATAAAAELQLDDAR